LVQVADSPWVELVSDATVRGIEVLRDTGEVTGLEVSSGTGSRFRIEATRYVLAAGAMENARLLLESPGVSGAGIGNEYDQVGRWFMDHLCVDTGIVAPRRPEAFDFASYEETATAGGARNQPMLWVGYADGARLRSSHCPVLGRRPGLVPWCCEHSANRPRTRAPAWRSLIFATPEAAGGSN